jgi:hypothetical protein
MSVATHPAANPVVPGKNGDIPPLENGDRLTRAEFMRRYAAMPEVKAELIEGVVYVPSYRLAHQLRSGNAGRGGE